MARALIKRLRDYTEKLAIKTVKEAEYIALLQAMYHGLPHLCHNHEDYKKSLSDFNLYCGCLVDIYRNFPELHNFFEEKGLAEVMENALMEKRRDKGAIKKSLKIAG